MMGNQGPVMMMGGMPGEGAGYLQGCLPNQVPLQVPVYPQGGVHSQVPLQSLPQVQGNLAMGPGSQGCPGTTGDPSGMAAPPVVGGLYFGAGPGIGEGGGSRFPAANLGGAMDMQGNPGFVGGESIGEATTVGAGSPGLGGGSTGP